MLGKFNEKTGDKDMIKMKLSHSAVVKILVLTALFLGGLELLVRQFTVSSGIQQTNGRY